MVRVLTFILSLPFSRVTLNTQTAFYLFLLGRVSDLFFIPTSGWLPVALRRNNTRVWQLYSGGVLFPSSPEVTRGLNNWIAAISFAPCSEKVTPWVHNRIAVVNYSHVQANKFQGWVSGTGAVMVRLSCFIGWEKISLCAKSAMG